MALPYGTKGSKTLLSGEYIPQSTGKMRIDMEGQQRVVTTRSTYWDNHTDGGSMLPWLAATRVTPKGRLKHVFARVNRYFCGMVTLVDVDITDTGVDVIAHDRFEPLMFLFPRDLYPLPAQALSQGATLTVTDYDDNLFHVLPPAACSRRWPIAAKQKDDLQADLTEALQFYFRRRTEWAGTTSYGQQLVLRSPRAGLVSLHLDRLDLAEQFEDHVLRPSGTDLVTWVSGRLHGSEHECIYPDSIYERIYAQHLPTAIRRIYRSIVARRSEWPWSVRSDGKWARMFGVAAD